MSTNTDFNSHWMIFDVFSQKWTVHEIELSLALNCCYGSIVTLRGLQYFFHQLSYYLDPYDKSTPIISRILKNGTIIDLKLTNPPFEKEFESYDLLHIKVAPFYQRFYQSK